MFIGLSVVFLSLLQAVAAHSLPGLMLPNHDFLGMAFRHLSARQTQPPSGMSNVPTECKASCDPINTQIAQGCPPDICCKAAFITGYFNCLKCVGVALGATDFTPAQASLDELVQACSARGLNVPDPTLPGVSVSNSPTSVPLSIRSSMTVSRPAQSTVSVLTSTPSPPPTTAISQLTVTAPLATPTPQSPPQITNTPSNAPSNAPSTSSAKSHRSFTPLFSQLSAFIVLLLGLVSFVL